MHKNQTVRTYIEGLDFLFGGEIQAIDSRNTCILLEGRPGSGKTTLALQIAFNIATETKGIAMVFSVEQPLDSLRRKVGNFNWFSKGEMSTLVLSGSDEDIKRAKQTKGGCIFLLSAQSGKFRTLRARIGSDIMAIKQNVKNKHIECIVVDSISAVKGKVPREAFLTLNRECSEDVSLSIFVDEENLDGGQFNLREYVSDIVIRLGSRYRTEKKDYLERFIEIIKVRNQFHYRGKHPFTIVNADNKTKQNGKKESRTKGGIFVYPSMAARLSSQFRETKAKEKKKTEEKENKEIKRFRLGIPTLDRLLFYTSEEEKGEEEKGEEEKREEKGGVAQGSTTLIIGERGTKKTVMSLHFLAEGIEDKQKGLLISLKDDESAIRAVASGYEILKKLSREEKYLQIKDVRPSHATPGNFLTRVKKWIETSEPAIQRVVFDNFAQIRIKFPLLDAEPMFIPTLIDLFRTKGITSLFIDIVEEPEKVVWEYKSPILDLADYVIATQHLPFLGKDHAVISVRRSLEGKHNTEPMEVRREKDKIYIDDRAFEGITGVLKREPKAVELLLKLFYENEAEKRFNDEIIEKLKQKYGENVHVSSFSGLESVEEYKRLTMYWMESPSSIVKVVSLDDHWVKYAAHKGMLWEIDKEWFEEEGTEGENWMDKEKEDFLSGALQAAELNDGLYAIPNYLGLGLFCYRKDLCSKYFHNKKHPKSFAELIDLFSDSLIEKLQKDDIYGFAFDMEDEETFVCTFLEFLYNTNTFNGKAGDKFLDVSEEDGPLILYDNDVKEAAIRALKTMKSLVKKHIMPFPCTIEHCKDSIFSRLWYSDIPKIYDQWLKEETEDNKKKDDQKKEPKFSIINFPAIEYNKRKGKNIDLDHYSCSGTWYLGILKQSLRPRIGYHLIDEITSTFRNFRRYQLGAGLPTRRTFYRFYGEKKVKGVENLTYQKVMDCFEGTSSDWKVFRREAFCGNNVELYHAVRPDIAKMIFEFLADKEKPAEETASDIMGNVSKAWKNLLKKKGNKSKKE